MMLSPGVRHTITHVVMRRTRSAIAKVGRSVTPNLLDARAVPQGLRALRRAGSGRRVVRDLRVYVLFFPLNLLMFMTSALVHLNGSKSGHLLVVDLAAAGIQVLAVIEERNKLVQSVVRHAPDVLICDDAQPGESLFRAQITSH